MQRAHRRLVQLGYLSPGAKTELTHATSPTWLSPTHRDRAHTGDNIRYNEFQLGLKIPLKLKDQTQHIIDKIVNKQESTSAMPSENKDR
jgi:hypothetical protein